MKKGRFICKLVLFTAVLALLLGLTAIAAAEECTSTNHVGPITEVNRVSATCTVNGSVQKKCTNCGAIIATEPIIAQGHHIGTQTLHITPATCTSTGLDQRIEKCSVPTCGYVQSTQDVTVPALGHQLGSAVTVQVATCTADGISRRSCTRSGCNYYEDTTLPQLGHQLGTPVTIQAATCEGTGISRKTCSRGCGYYEDTTLPALGHQWGSPVTKAATCVSPATTTKTCQRDSSHKDVVETGSPDTTNGHVWGDWKVTRKATCMEPAQESRVCKLSSAHVEYREVGTTDMVNGHKWDNGVVTKKPTTTEEGEMLYTCQLNSSHTKTVKLDTELMKNNTLCAFGPRLRDTNLYPYNTDAWYMFTPFDASKEGTQTFELVASNTYIVGTVTLTIRDGNLKIDYTIADTARFKVTEEFFTVLNRITDLTQYEPEQLTDLRLGKGETINLEEKFGDDTSLVLYFCSRCDFRYSKKFTFLQYESAAHQRQLNIMLDLMD